MRYRFVFFIVITVTLLLSDCARPFGSIDDFVYDDFWVISTHPTYNLTDPLPRRDISVFGSFQGAVDVIPVDTVDLFVQETSNGELNPIPKDRGYEFSSYGKKRIVAIYHEMEAEYSIQVLNPNGGSGNGNGNGNGSGNPGEGSGGSLDGDLFEW
jgi:hypothetical protein